MVTVAILNNLQGNFRKQSGDRHKRKNEDMKIKKHFVLKNSLLLFMLIPLSSKREK